jgi:hypothetical protein
MNVELFAVIIRMTWLRQLKDFLEHHVSANLVQLYQDVKPWDMMFVYAAIINLLIVQQHAVKAFVFQRMEEELQERFFQPVPKITQ